MADYGFPFPAINDDRMYGAADWAAYFAQFISNGVFPIGSQLQVTASSGMQVNVSAGAAWINGYGRAFNTAYILTVDPADGVLNRIDRIVVRWGRVERNVYLHVLKGTPASAPTAPPLTRDADYYDLCLVEISVNAGITGIAAAHISDKRLNPDLCGIVSSVITPDTAGWYEGWETEFQTWFTHIKELLADDPATELAAAVATLESEMDTAQADISELENAAAAKPTSGTAPNFTVADTTVTAYAAGLRRTIIVHADSGASPTLNFNGKGAKNVYQFTGKAAKWSAGQHVMVEYDGTNFFVCSAGGGTDLPAVISAGETIIKQWLGTKGYSKSAGWSGWYTITGLSFTVGVTGTYRLKLFVSNYYYVSLRFWKNNAAQVGTTVTYNNSGNNATILQDIPLNAGDVVVVQLSSLTSAGSPGLNFSEITAKILADDIQNLLNSALLLTVS